MTAYVLGKQVNALPVGQSCGVDAAGFHEKFRDRAEFFKQHLDFLSRNPEKAFVGLQIFKVRGICEGYAAPASGSDGFFYERSHQCHPEGLPKLQKL